MIKFENTEVVGWEHAIRGMRNPLNSWGKSDSEWSDYPHEKDAVQYKGEYGFQIGENDADLMQRLRVAGAEHRKYLRMIVVYVDITAPLYWWKEFDTYKVGTTANSCSTMHKIADKEFMLDDFSHEQLRGTFLKGLEAQISLLNSARAGFLRTKDKMFWWQMIQLLPTSYNQKRTVMLNYEVLNAIYNQRKNHKLDEWRVGFIDWIKTLPYAKELITGEV